MGSAPRWAHEKGDLAVASIMTQWWPCWIQTIHQEIHDSIPHCIRRPIAMSLKGCAPMTLANFRLLLSLRLQSLRLPDYVLKQPNIRGVDARKVARRNFTYQFDPSRDIVLCDLRKP